MRLLTFTQIVLRLIEQDGVISYEGVLKMDLVQGAGMVCAGHAFPPSFPRSPASLGPRDTCNPWSFFCGLRELF